MSKSVRQPFRAAFLTAIVFLSICDCQTTVQTIYIKYCLQTANSTNSTTPNQAFLPFSGIGFDITTLSALLSKGSAGPLVSQIGTPVILTAVLMIVFLGAFLTFSIFCCACDKSETPNGKCSKIMNVISLILCISALAFVGILGYLTMSLNGQLNRVICSFIRIPVEFMTGVSYPTAQFIGLGNIMYTVGNFSNSIANNEKVLSSFQNIYHSTIDSDTESGIKALNDFYANYANSTTSDGAGSTGKPNTIKSLTSTINSAIGKEFQTYYYGAKQAIKASEIGLGIGTQPSIVPQLQESAQTVLASLKTITETMNSTVSNAIVAVDYVLIYSTYGFWAMAGAAAFATLLLITLIVFMLRALSKEEDSCRNCFKLALAIACLVGLLTAILALFLLIVSIVVTGTCNSIFSGLSMSASNATEIVTSYGINSTDLVGKLLTQCVPSGVSGSALNLVPNTDSNVQNAVVYIDGLTSLKSMLANITSEGITSPSISATLTQWENVRTSVTPDQPNAITTLNTLNSKVSCGGVVFQMNSLSCTSNSCQGVYQTSNPAYPGCSDQTSQQLFQNLKAFTTDQDSLLTAMMQSLNSTTANPTLSPNVVQQQYRINIKSLSNDFAAIESTAGSFLAASSVYTGGFVQNTNCSIVRYQLTEIQTAACTGFSQTLYLLVVCGLIYLVLLLVALWLFFCGMRYSGSFLERVAPVDLETLKENSYADKEFENVIY